MRRAPPPPFFFFFTGSGCCAAGVVVDALFLCMRVVLYPACGRGVELELELGSCIGRADTCVL